MDCVYVALKSQDCVLLNNSIFFLDGLWSWVSFLLPLGFCLEFFLTKEAYSTTPETRRR